MTHRSFLLCSFCCEQLPIITPLAAPGALPGIESPENSFIYDAINMAHSAADIVAIPGTRFNKVSSHYNNI